MNSCGRSFGRGAWVLAWLTMVLSGLLPVHAQIVVGQTSGFTGPVASGVKENTDGARLLFDEVNRAGGIDGKKIELVSLDDEFKPELARANALRLITEYKATALFLNRGTPHTEALLPLLEKYQIPLVGSSSGAMVLHQPVRPWVFNVRAPYQKETELAVRHLDSIGVSRIGLLYTDDSFGNDAVQGAQREMGRLHIEPIFSVKFAREAPQTAQLVDVVLRQQPQAVIFIGAAATVAEGILALRAGGFRAQVLTLSNNASEGFIRSLGNQSAGVIVTQVFPNENSLSTPLVSEMSRLARAHGLAHVTPAMVEGYAAAKVLVEGLRRAGPNPNRASLVKALNGLQKWDLGGLDLHYDPSDHGGLSYAELSIISPSGQFRR